MHLSMNPDWLTVGEVDSCQTLSKVLMDDDVAVMHEGDDDWTIGIVTEIGTYSNRSTRWKEKRTITVKLHTPIHHPGGHITTERTFYELLVEQIVFKN